MKKEICIVFFSLLSFIRFLSNRRKRGKRSSSVFLGLLPPISPSSIILGLFCELLPSRLSIPGAERSSSCFTTRTLCVHPHISQQQSSNKIALCFHLHTYKKRRTKKKEAHFLFSVKKKLLLYPRSYLFCLFWYSGMEKRKEPNLTRFPLTCVKKNPFEEEDVHTFPLLPFCFLLRQKSARG